MNALKSKSNDVLISDLKSLVSKERETLMEIIDHLREIEDRKLYLERGYPSLFLFLTQELKYSESAAIRRLSAMSLVDELPEITEQIKEGRISLTVASRMQGYLRSEQKKRVLSLDEKLEVVYKLSGTSTRECDQILAQLDPETTLPKERIKPLNPDKTLIQFTADRSLVDKIQRLKDLLGNHHETPSLETVFEKALDLALEKLDPELRSLRREQRQQKLEAHAFPPPTSAVKKEKPSRYIPDSAESPPP